MMAKLRGALRSWTVWFNSLAALAWAFLPDLLDWMPSVAPYVDEGIYKKAMLVLLVGNLALRFKTRHGLGDKP
jgi:hypothetical protein